MAVSKPPVIDRQASQICKEKAWKTLTSRPQLSLGGSDSFASCAPSQQLKFLAEINDGSFRDYLPVNISLASPTH